MDKSFPRAGSMKKKSVPLIQRSIMYIGRLRICHCTKQINITFGDLMEQAAIQSRPAILGKVMNLKQYMLSFIGQMTNRHGKRRIFTQGMVVDMPYIRGSSQYSSCHPFHPFGQETGCAVGYISLRHIIQAFNHTDRTRPVAIGCGARQDDGINGMFPEHLDTVLDNTRNAAGAKMIMDNGNAHKQIKVDAQKPVDIPE